MSTKAEQFASRVRRAAAKKKAAPKAQRDAKKKKEGEGAATTRRALRETSGRSAGGKTAARNVKDDGAQHSSYVLEDSGTGRPSRKSTRRGANRIKPDSQLKRRQTRRTTAPKARARRAAAKDSRG